MTEREKEVFKQVMDLRDKGVEFMTIESAGGGDSGAIEQYFFYNKSVEEVMWEDDNLEHHESEHFNFVLTTELEDHIYGILNTIEDWWNNDGGYGTILIRLKDLKYKIDNNVYYTQTEHYSHEGKFNLKL